MIWPDLNRYLDRRQRDDEKGNEGQLHENNEVKPTALPRGVEPGIRIDSTRRCEAAR